MASPVLPVITADTPTRDPTSSPWLLLFIEAFFAVFFLNMIGHALVGFWLSPIMQYLIWSSISAH